MLAWCVDEAVCWLMDEQGGCWLSLCSEEGEEAATPAGDGSLEGRLAASSSVDTRGSSTLAGVREVVASGVVMRLHDAEGRRDRTSASAVCAVLLCVRAEWAEDHHSHLVCASVSVCASSMSRHLQLSTPTSCLSPHPSCAVILTLNRSPARCNSCSSTPLLVSAAPPGSTRCRPLLAHSSSGARSAFSFSCTYSAVTALLQQLSSLERHV